MKVLVHATRGNLSQGGVLFYCDPNSYEDIKIKESSDGAKRGPSPWTARRGVRGAAAPRGTVRVVTDLD